MVQPAPRISTAPTAEQRHLPGIGPPDAARRVPGGGGQRHAPPAGQQQQPGADGPVQAHEPQIGASQAPARLRMIQDFSGMSTGSACTSGLPVRRSLCASLRKRGDGLFGAAMSLIEKPRRFAALRQWRTEAPGCQRRPGGGPSALPEERDCAARSVMRWRCSTGWMANGWPDFGPVARVGPRSTGGGPASVPRPPARTSGSVFAPHEEDRATDFVVGKATELGVSAIQPVTTRHSETARVNLDRLRATAIEAAEQTESAGRAADPGAAEPKDLR